MNDANVSTTAKKAFQLSKNRRMWLGSGLFFVNIWVFLGWGSYC